MSTAILGYLTNHFRSSDQLIQKLRAQSPGDGKIYRTTLPLVFKDDTKNDDILEFLANEL